MLRLLLWGQGHSKNNFIVVFVYYKFKRRFKSVLNLNLIDDGDMYYILHMFSLTKSNDTQNKFMTIRLRLAAFHA